MRPAEAAYELANEIADTLSKMERLGNPARYVIVNPDTESYGQIVAQMRPALVLRVTPNCPPGELFLMADFPDDWPVVGVGSVPENPQ
jgi:hypothetical protein